MSQNSQADERRSGLPDTDLEKANFQPEKITSKTEQPYLEQKTLHGKRSQSRGDDVVVHVPHAEAGDEIFDKFSKWRKRSIIFILAFCGFLSPVSSTAVLSAVPEVAHDYGTTGAIINVSNALYLAFMGLSPIFFGPLSAVIGRRPPYLFSAILFTIFSIGTAVAPNLASFFIFRIFTAFQGTGFLIVGSAAVGDIYRPTERATALSWFLCGALIGPAIGPFIGGLIVTFRSWRVIFWLQTALGGTALILIAFGLPETAHHRKATELQNIHDKRVKMIKLGEWFNPLRVFALFRLPNLWAAGLATGSLVWNMYSLVTPIRYVLNPRFHLETPMQSAFLYLAPGVGYVVGSLFGGRWADRTVKTWIDKRGERVPEDRLRSSLPFMLIAIPACMLTYGWSVETGRGGLALPIVAMFLQGVAQLFCFPSVNVYCIEVIQGRSSEVIAGNYVARYVTGALGSAVVLPAIQKIGVGWFSTISAGFLILSGGALYATVVFGQGWRESKKGVQET